MPSIHDIVVTDELRAQYANCWIKEDKTIQSFEYIKSLSTKRLQSIIEYNKKGHINYDSKKLKALASELSPDGMYINYTWILSRVGEELYDREILDDDEWSDLQRELD